jgi:hypothetical protein
MGIVTCGFGLELSMEDIGLVSLRGTMHYCIPMGPKRAHIPPKNGDHQGHPMLCGSGSGSWGKSFVCFLSKFAEAA